LLQTRVHMLSTEARGLLQVCCVYGVYSTAKRIEQAIGLSPELILRGLGELDASGMIEVDGSRILSRHDTLSSVVLSLVGDAPKLMLHRYVAKQLEEEGDFTNSVSMIWESAEHWLSASEPQRALQLLRRCGNHLNDVGMPDEAAKVLERAQNLSADPAERYGIGAERAGALMRAQRSMEAAKVVEDLLPLRSLIQPSPSPLDEVGLISLQARSMNCASVPELVREGLIALSSPNTSSDERLATARFLMVSADNLCSASLGREIYESVREDLSSQHSSVEARLWFEMIHHCCVGLPRLALEFADELLKYTREKNIPIAMMAHLRHAAHVHACHGRLDTAKSLVDEGFQIATRLNAFRTMAINAGLIASMLMHEGDNEAAEHWLQRAMECYEPKDHTMLDMNLLSNRAELAIRLGRPQEARGHIEYCRIATLGFQTARSNARSMALQTHLAVVAEESIEADRLDEFSMLFEAVRSSPWQDYTAEALLLGLSAANNQERANRIARDYVLKYRRDTGELSRPLTRVIQSVCGELPRPVELG
jgi:tetratricopeptide (TPR) repeat protein